MPNITQWPMTDYISFFIKKFNSSFLFSSCLLSYLHGRFNHANLYRFYWSKKCNDNLNGQNISSNTCIPLLDIKIIIVTIFILLQVLNHPNVYKFMHIPVQSGSDAVLSDMKREYKRSDFTRVVDTLRKVSYLPKS